MITLLSIISLILLGLTIFTGLLLHKSLKRAIYFKQKAEFYKDFYDQIVKFAKETKEVDDGYNSRREELKKAGIDDIPFLKELSDKMMGDSLDKYKHERNEHFTFLIKNILDIDKENNKEDSKEEN